jgi:prolyl oligopeptidase PreP (S9A serine peptidase family)
MKRIEALRTKRQNHYIEARVNKSLESLQEQNVNEIKKHINLVVTPEERNTAKIQKISQYIENFKKKAKTESS